MSLAAGFVKNPVKVYVGAILLGVFGAIALMRMPMQLVPEVSTPTITIETRWSGASPQEVEREIIQEQEEQLKGVEGVTKMSAECMDSMGKITLEFSVGTDMSAALLRVNTRLSQVPEYPEEADEPVLSSASSSDQPIAWFVLRPRVPTLEELDAFQKEHPELKTQIQEIRKTATVGMRSLTLHRLAEKHKGLEPLLPPPVDITKQRRFAEDNIEATFERVKGVSNSNVLGGREDEMQVRIDPQRLAARGVTITDVRRALRERNVDVSAGDYWDGKRRYVVRTLGQFKSPAEVASVIVRESEGARVYVRDVAEVELGYKKADGDVRTMGTTVLAINVIRDGGANVLDVMSGLYAAKDRLNAGVLKDYGLQLDQVYDETDYIHSAVGLVEDNILLAGILTVLVLLIFLRSPRSTLVIAVAIPTSVIGTFLMLSLMGRSLNVISLAGLAFAVGMLVDNAVVVLENIYRYYQMGERRFDAAVKGTKEVWGAVLASTLTTLAVFLPILFVQEQAGQLFRDIALAISSAVALSMLVSITLIPVATSQILPSRTMREKKAAGRGRNPLNVLFYPFDVVARFFVRHVLLVHRFLQGGWIRQLVVAGVLIAGTWFLSQALLPKPEYLPEGNRNLAIGLLLPPPGYNLDELTEMGSFIEKELTPYWDTQPGSEEAKQLAAPPMEHFFFVNRGRQVFLGMRAHDPLRAGQYVPLIQRFNGQIPGTYAVAFKSSLFARGLSGGRTIDIEITGPELTNLVALGGRIFGMVMGVVPGSQVRPIPSLDLSNPEVHVEPRWERAADMGFSTTDLGYTVNSLVDGAYAGDYFLAGEKIDLTILGEERFASDLHDIENLTVATPAGDLVPLRAVAHVSLQSGPEQINRRERERAITIQVTPPEEVPLQEAIDRIEEQVIAPLAKQKAIGGAYQVNLSGTADKLDATFEALKFNLILAVLITYLLMAALFESWLYPVVILVSVPLGAAGGLLGLWLLNTYITFQALDVLTMLGFVILIGTVVNNAILIVHQSLVYIREEGDEVNDAVLKSIESRIRPIFMTVTTTVCGLLPLVLRPGAGSELYRGLGSVLIGGLIVSTLFTLVLVPVLFRLLMDARTLVLVRIFRRTGGSI